MVNTDNRLVEASEFRLTWIAGAVGVVGPAAAAFIASTYHQLPANDVIPAAVLGVIAVSIVSVCLVFIGDMQSRASIAAASLREQPAPATPSPDRKPVQAPEFRLTWIATLIGVEGPALAGFIANQYPGVRPDDLVIPVAVLTVIAASVVSVALVYLFDVRFRTAATVAYRARPALELMLSDKDLLKLRLPADALDGSREPRDSGARPTTSGRPAAGAR